MSVLIVFLQVGTYSLGPVAPFDASATVLAIGGIAIAFMWNENYGVCMRDGVCHCGVGWRVGGVGLV
jgi:hypothetical protein